MARALPSEVFRLGDSLTPEEKLVLLALIDYGSRIYPSQGTLAVKTGYCVRTIGTVVQSLRTKGVLTTFQRGAKGLTYVITLDPQRSAPHAEIGRHAMPSTSASHAEQVGMPCRGIRTSKRTNQKNPAPADAGGVVASPWDGIDPEDCRRVRNWYPRGDADALCVAQRLVTLRKLAELGVRVTDHAKWWRRLGQEWARIGVPPYDQLATALESLGEVRDRVAVLAFRIGLGKVAA